MFVLQKQALEGVLATMMPAEVLDSESKPGMYYIVLRVDGVPSWEGMTLNMKVRLNEDELEVFCRSLTIWHKFIGADLAFNKEVEFEVQPVLLPDSGNEARPYLRLVSICEKGFPRFTYRF